MVKLISKLWRIIQNFYDDPGNSLAFVLLVEDAPQVVTPSVVEAPMYALLAGSDNYPNILMGRFSAESVPMLTLKSKSRTDLNSEGVTLFFIVYRATLDCGLT